MTKPNRAPQSVRPWQAVAWVVLFLAAQAGVSAAEPTPSAMETDAAGWVVEGRAVERAVALSDITNLEALAYVQQRLRSLGVDKALARAGARDGDPVQIGSFHFDYLAD